MKKDFFDIHFFFESSEIIEILQLFPHRIYDSYNNLLSSSKSDQFNDNNKISTPIGFNNENYFTLDSFIETAPLLNLFLKSRLEQHFNFRKALYSFDFNRDVTDDSLSLLKDMERNSDKGEEVLLGILPFIRSKILVSTVHLFLVKDKSKLIWLPEKKDVSSKEEISNCDLFCANFAANQKKAFVCNDPRENEVYLKFTPNLENMPKNFVYAPVLSNGETLAVLGFKNYLLGDFTDKEMEIIYFTAQVSAQYLTECRFKNVLQKIEHASIGLEKYISANLVTHIKEKKINLSEASGVEKEIVVLFAKINNFSEISEKISASALIDLLNYHYEFMAKVISENNGTIDKIIGHVIMAIWNHPDEQENGLELAVNTAIEMQKISAAEVAPVWKERGIFNYGLGIGINKGAAVVGNLGAKQFMDFTVIGDTINLAQRLESQAKSGEIWIRKDVIKLDKNLKFVPDRIINGVKIKGKTFPINVCVFTPLEEKSK